MSLLTCTEWGSTDLQQVELNTALHVNGLVFSAAHLLALKIQVFQNWFDASHSAQVRKIIHLKTREYLSPSG